MRPRLFDIQGCPSGKLSIMARPRGGEWLADEIAYLRRDGVNTLLSLLEEVEVDECGLLEEEALAVEAGIVFRNYPIPDRGVPASRELAWAVAIDIAEKLRGGRQVAIHCRAGIGRSALMAACVLVALGVPIREVWQRIEAARGLRVPDTDEQRAWVATMHQAGR